MSDNQFKVGDIVQLKSGGPNMTVSAFHVGEVECTFWNPSTEQMSTLKVFPNTLQKCDTESPSVKKK